MATVYQLTYLVALKTILKAQKGAKNHAISDYLPFARPPSYFPKGALKKTANFNGHNIAAYWF